MENVNETNPFLELKQGIEKLRTERDVVDSKIEELTEYQILKKQRAEIQKKIDEVYKSDEYYTLRKKCNHINEEGKYVSRYTGQCPGSGKSEYVCDICGDC